MVAAWLLGAALAAHPLHTTVTELVIARGSARMTVHAFADDFGRAALGLGPDAPAPAAVADSLALAYIRSRLEITGAAGPLRLRWCGVERRGDAYVFCVVADGVGDAAGLRLRNRMHTELYADQVNIVRVTAGRDRSSLMFTRGDAAKTLSRR